MASSLEDELWAWHDNQGDKSSKSFSLSFHWFPFGLFGGRKIRGHLRMCNSFEKLREETFFFPFKDHPLVENFGDLIDSLTTL